MRSPNFQGDHMKGIQNPDCEGIWIQNTENYYFSERRNSVVMMTITDPGMTGRILV